MPPRDYDEVHDSHAFRRTGETPAGEHDEVHDSHAFRRTGEAGAGQPDEVHGDPAVAQMAASRRGLVSTAELRTELGRGAVAHRVRQKRLHRCHRGVYLVGHEVAPELAREAAARLAVGDDAVLSFHTAAALLGMAPAHDGDVHVTVAGRQPRSRAGIRVHSVTAWDSADVGSSRGLPVTSPARTLVDLATVLAAPRLERAAEQAHLQGLYRRADMLALMQRAPGGRGTRVLREVLMLDEDPVLLRSRAERLMRRLVRGAALAEPECNVRVAGWERDFVWRTQRLIVEVDGWQFHSSRAAFERDRRRDASAVANGFRVMRVTWRRMHREPAALLVDLARALATA